LKLFKWLLSIIVISFLITGCSSGKLSEEEATTIALEFAKTNAQENNLNISPEELKLIQTERVDKMDKWVVYIDYPNVRNHDEINKTITTRMGFCFG
jgi:PBP1b-binding outer membrane lipoprotein LpoB